MEEEYKKKGKNKDTIPVVFSSGQDSYTDGTKVVISAKLDEKVFDSTVGLALHEGSHIALTNFNVLTNQLGYGSPETDKLVEWHKEYEITSEWIDKNNIKIINISNYINGLKMKLNDYIGFHVTYEDIYVNKSSVYKILDYMGVISPNHLDMLEYEKKYRKDKNVFIKKHNGLI